MARKGQFLSNFEIDVMCSESIKRINNEFDILEMILSEQIFKLAKHIEENKPKGKELNYIRTKLKKMKSFQKKLSIIKIPDAEK